MGVDRTGKAFTGPRWTKTSVWRELWLGGHPASHSTPCSGGCKRELNRTAWLRLGAAVDLVAQTRDGQKRQNRREPLVAVNNYVGPLRGSLGRKENVVPMWHPKFISIRDFHPERNTTMNGLFDLGYIHGRIVGLYGYVVNTHAAPDARWRGISRTETGCHCMMVIRPAATTH
jgi:hypothetical protein